MEYLETDDQNNFKIKDAKLGIMDYKLVGVCEFTSDRRLSSNIYKNTDGTYTIYTKGSDT
jgi:magnesium-transporting ATPase (P-type)